MVLFKIGAMGGGVGVLGSMVGLLDVVGIIFVFFTTFSAYFDRYDVTGYLVWSLLLLYILTP